MLKNTDMLSKQLEMQSLSLHREIRVDNRMYHAENKYAYERIECWKIIRLQTEFGEMPTYR